MAFSLCHQARSSKVLAGVQMSPAADANSSISPLSASSPATSVVRVDRPVPPRAGQLGFGQQ
jgi:hypothetical protein